MGSPPRWLFASRSALRLVLAAVLAGVLTIAILAQTSGPPVVAAKVGQQSSAVSQRSP